MMASSNSYLEYVLDLLSGLDDITCRPMMGEYMLYYRGRIFGGIYDDRFLVKPVKAAVEMMPEAEYEVPYEGAREMLMVDTEDREFLTELIERMYPELPVAKKR